METVQISTEAILRHHLEAFCNNDVEALIKDYVPTSEVWTPDGALIGLDSISSFYSYVFTLLPKESLHFEVRKEIVKGNKAYIVWNASSTIINVPLGTDSFEIEDGKIVWQSLAAHIVPAS
ncbi:nuclear transport factor 2 family protein [uncultured Hymenobacter sp.]|uniref:nuclear transport factor 2 family protein n=1 Tax=uncultured Hymenobacter sp. TaxID=170016 RepID=UPI0035C99992